ncbi:hypothetical protein N9U93_00950 [Candidatus Pelagibacter sp.]|nr:hypothetical protein [Candidatus Pelagibacter sp.]
MINKIIIIISLGFFLFTCGKKGDPVYKESSYKLEIINSQKNVPS